MSSSQNIPVITIAAHSGTGKTTLITNLIPFFTKKNIKVGVLKHSHHQIEIDQPGKDSYQISHAGAAQMLIASEQTFAMVSRPPSPISFEQLLLQFDASLCDLIIVEGYKGSSYDNLVLLRDAAPRDNNTLITENTIAIATDKPVNTTIPTLNINQPEAIANFLINRYINKSF